MSHSIYISHTPSPVHSKRYRYTVNARLNFPREVPRVFNVDHCQNQRYQVTPTTSTLIPGNVSFFGRRRLPDLHAVRSKRPPPLSNFENAWTRRNLQIPVCRTSACARALLGAITLRATRELSVSRGTGVNIWDWKEGGGTGW